MLKYLLILFFASTLPAQVVLDYTAIDVSPAKYSGPIDLEETCSTCSPLDYITYRSTYEETTFLVHPNLVKPRWPNYEHLGQFLIYFDPYQSGSCIYETPGGCVPYVGCQISTTFVVPGIIPGYEVSYVIDGIPNGTLDNNSTVSDLRLITVSEAPCGGTDSFAAFFYLYDTTVTPRKQVASLFFIWDVYCEMCTVNPH